MLATAWSAMKRAVSRSVLKMTLFGIFGGSAEPASKNCSSFWQKETPQPEKLARGSLVSSTIVVKTCPVKRHFEVHPGTVDLSRCYGSKDVFDETGSDAAWDNGFAMNAINITFRQIAHLFTALFDDLDQSTGLHECFEFFRGLVVPKATTPDIRLVALTFDAKLMTGLVPVFSPMFSQLFEIDGTAWSKDTGRTLFRCEFHVRHF